MFSRRSSFDLTPNRFGRLLGEKRAAGARLLDLTESNPTRSGFSHPRPEALAALADPGGLAYEPEPFGLASARRALADEYRGRGQDVLPERVALVASSSEAYSYLFKLLCDPGDQVLVPRPSYPLFDFLAELEHVELRPYRLDPERSFAVDLDSVEEALTPKTRAILLVSPNNPTGSVTSEVELQALGTLAAERGLALISDEVFADFLFAADDRAPIAALGSPAALSFSLGGLSKSCGMPQLKLGWVMVGGPPDRVEPALARLEVIADTYLSVSTPVQRALPALLAAGRDFRAECLARVRRNREALARAAARHPAVTLLPAQGGWYACLRVPRTASEEEMTLALLEDGVAVHPGYFFDFAGEAYLVVSLIAPARSFDEAVEIVLRRCG